MRELDKEIVVSTISRLCLEANTNLPLDVAKAINHAKDNEVSACGRDVLTQISRNIDIAREQHMPLCQDTGAAVFFVELGRDVHLNFDLEEAINEGVRDGYTQGYLRKSMVRDPLKRVNTNDNTPAIIYLKSVAGEKLKVTFAPKGGGTENMSTLKLLMPYAGEEAVKEFIIDTVKQAGPNPCPPVIVGVGIGGTFEKAAYLAKEALLRPFDIVHSDPYYANMEQELLERINALGIGPMGLGGRTTALRVLINVFPCHIASLPVAVNMQCHCARHLEHEI